MRFHDVMNCVKIDYLCEIMWLDLFGSKIFYNLIIDNILYLTWLNVLVSSWTMPYKSTYCSFVICNLRTCPLLFNYFVGYIFSSNSLYLKLKDGFLLSWRTYMQACSLSNVMQSWIELSTNKERGKQKWPNVAMGYVCSSY